MLSRAAFYKGVWAHVLYSHGLFRAKIISIRAASKQALNVALILFAGRGTDK